MSLGTNLELIINKFLKNFNVFKGLSQNILFLPFHCGLNYHFFSWKLIKPKDI